MSDTEAKCGVTEYADDPPRDGCVLHYGHTGDHLYAPELRRAVFDPKANRRKRFEQKNRKRRHEH